MFASGRTFPENRENNREFLEILPDFGHLAQFREPVVRQIQQLAVKFPVLRKTARLLPETANWFNGTGDSL